MQNLELLIQALKQERVRRNDEEKKYDWDMNARPEQQPPDGDWFGWFIMAGRGFGKTRTGAETIRKFVLNNEYKRICLVGETYDQVRSIMIEGESGLLNVHTKEEMPKFRPGKRELIWPNGTVAQCFSAENYEALRGPQFDLAWVDELAKFDKAQEVWDQLMFCLRLGNAPKVIITTTPKPTNLIQELCKRKDIHLTRGSTFDNSKNLSPAFLKMLERQYANTKIGKQEIEGEILNMDSNALWTKSNIYYESLENINLNELNIIIAIDPATSSNENSNETGIIVAGKKDENYYILEDKSGIMKPEVWACVAHDLFKKYNAKEIIVETNQGGEILMSMLNSFANIPWKSVRAAENKYKRAMPIASLYNQKKVKHIKKFDALEEQMLKAHIKFADDRMDALVWVLFSLMQTQKKQPAQRRTITAWSC